MKIEESITNYVVYAEDTILRALTVVNRNSHPKKFALVTDERGALEGVISDGDIRRWLVASRDLDLSKPVRSMMNVDFKYALEGSSNEQIQSLLSGKIDFVPILSKQGVLRAVAVRGEQSFSIDGCLISENGPSYIIAEIGNNHNGSLELAKKLVDLAKGAGANCAKFQMRNLQSLYRNGADGVNDADDLAAQYTKDLLQKVQLSKEDLFRVFDHCMKIGITPMCTPWDPESFENLKQYGLPAYKIASADLTNHDLLELVATANMPMIVSTGMSSQREITDAVRLLRQRSTKFAILHCNSTYPTPFKDVQLKYLNQLKLIADGAPIGYSGHERGFHVVLGAVSLGAKIIEKHFTIDKTMEGSDHKVSLLPNEFTDMVRSIRELEEALAIDGERQMSQGELMNRENLAKSLVASRRIRCGDVITADDISIRSPGNGLQPSMKNQLIGQTARRDINISDFFYPSDLGLGDVVKKKFDFPMTWGIPTRYHDFIELVSESNLPLVEFHLSYRDLNADLSKYLKGVYNTKVVVHSPELFENDHILDLCSPDEDYRIKSIHHINRVIEHTEQLMPFFPKNRKICIVTNVGGFSENTFLSAKEREGRMLNLKKSLKNLRESACTEIIIQTMPPFPWHFGGQRFHNLFVDPNEIAGFCRAMKMKICLDVSHSQLACTQHNLSLSEFIKITGPYIEHIHISDAKGTDGEGLQVGEGNIDFGKLGRNLREYCPDASFIPEVWQGHKNGGRGFWIALERLEYAFNGGVK